ncbi:hypothetical protein B9G98_03439 [Wickerhamiella sorbophila]|uniref:Uncharacterized protein n=1 Tax=Wickerhamiella sorbophila TaxID=45607 RepID=A0A2T0FLF7_9ASCO|nr:hypothetical protein B9G98_03439 [Wickerhamiella sorbophila]PRT55819.1 hypothetical protein B9G98_03439 [Wickerhamiella sorbophila]
MDYKRLDVERAKMAVSVAGAKSLVSEWMGADVFNDDEEDDVVSRLLKSAEKAKPPPTDKNQALERLRTKMNHKKPASKPRPVVQEQSSDDEEESKTSSIGKRKNVKSVLDSYKRKKRKG